jgi:hypothetical protein
MELNSEYIIKVDAKTLVPTYYKTPTGNSGPRRGHFDSQTGCGSRRTAARTSHVRSEDGEDHGVEGSDALLDAV